MSLAMQILIVALLVFFGETRIDATPLTPFEISPILIGSSIPEADLKDQNGNPVNLKQEIAKKPAIMIVYRGGWCPICNTHFGQLHEVLQQATKNGWQILAVSPDKPEFLEKTAEKQSLDYLLLSDSDMSFSKALGIAFKVDDATIEKYKEYKIDLELASGMKHHLLPVPSVFVVDTAGIIKFSYVNPDYKIRLAPGVLQAVLDSEKNLMKK